MKKLVSMFVVALMAAVIAVALPDIKRYLEMRRM